MKTTILRLTRAQRLLEAATLKNPELAALPARESSSVQDALSKAKHHIAFARGALAACADLAPPAPPPSASPRGSQSPLDLIVDSLNSSSVDALVLSASASVADRVCAARALLKEAAGHLRRASARAVADPAARLAAAALQSAEADRLSGHAPGLPGRASRREAQPAPSAKPQGGRRRSSRQSTTPARAVNPAA